MTYYTITKNGNDTGVRYDSYIEAQLAICAILWYSDEVGAYEVQPVDG